MLTLVAHQCSHFYGHIHSYVYMYPGIILILLLLWLYPVSGTLLYMHLGKTGYINKNEYTARDTNLRLIFKSTWLHKIELLQTQRCESIKGFLYPKHTFRIFTTNMARKVQRISLKVCPKKIQVVQPRHTNRVLMGF